MVAGMRVMAWYAKAMYGRAKNMKGIRSHYIRAWP